MSTESELLNDINEKNPDVVLLGERHSGTTDFRKIVLHLLPELQSAGFQILALELTPDYETELQRFCSGTIEYDEFISLVPTPGDFLECFDQALLLAVRDWVQNGDQLVFVNSKDPTSNYPAENDIGRDEFMFQQLSGRTERIVALLGNAHCQIRSNRNRHFCPPDEKADVYNHRLGFLTAAEKLKDSGKNVYCFAEFSTDSDRGKKQHYPEKLMIQATMDPHLRTIKQEEYAGGGYGSLGPELPRQVVYFVPGELDAVYIDDVDHQATAMKKLIGQMNSFKGVKGKRILGGVTGKDV